MNYGRVDLTNHDRTMLRDYAYRRLSEGLSKWKVKTLLMEEYDLNVRDANYIVNLIASSLEKIK